MYQQCDLNNKIQNCIKRLFDGALIPFDHQNSDFQAFCTSILDGLAELQDADGTLMSAEQAIAFVNTIKTN